MVPKFHGRKHTKPLCAEIAGLAAVAVLLLPVGCEKASEPVPSAAPAVPAAKSDVTPASPGDRPVGVSSEDQVPAFINGVWTYTEPGPSGGLWFRLEFSPDGKVNLNYAPPAADDWGDAEKWTWKTTTGKNNDTGHRWYGVEVRGTESTTPRTLIFTDEGRLLFHFTVDAPVLLSKGEKFPFSK